MANNYLRRDQQARAKKPVAGDHPVDLKEKARASTEEELATTELLESIYDDAVRLNLLEQTEETVAALEAAAAEKLAQISELIDPDKNFPLVKAISTLKGEPHLTLDGEILQMAADLGMDGYVHLNGFDPVAAMLGLHGGDDKPNVPIPRLFMDCDELQRMENVPSPSDDDFETTTVDEVHIEVEQVKAMDIYTKLWELFKYFPGVDIKKFLKKIKNRWTKRPVNRAIRWVECNMINPGWFLLTGESRSCSAADTADDPPDPGEIYNLQSDDLIGTGLDCMEAAAMVTSHVQKYMAKEPGISAMYQAMEERARHEALKFGQLNVNIKNKKRFKDRIDKLQEKTKEIPRYKKRYYDNKDDFIKSVENDNIKMTSEF